MPKKITTGLSAKGFQDAAKEVRQYKAELIRKTELFAERLAQEGVNIAKVKIMEYPAVYTGELLNSITDEPGAMISNGSSWIIYTACEWAPFVEFGTGVIGEQNPHPDTGLANWKYDTNEHGEAGWHYFKEGEWHWTKGMPSRPIFYETGRDLRLIVPKIAREVFG